MFERFTPPSLKVVVAAVDEAKSRAHPSLEPEHLLLALLQLEDGLAAAGLTAAGLHYDDVVARLEPAGDPQSAGQFPFSPDAKAALDAAVAAADAMKHDWIGTEHLLFGLAEVRPELAPAADAARQKLQGN